MVLHTAVSQQLLLEQLLPGRHDVLVDLLDLKRTDDQGFATFESETLRLTCRDFLTPYLKSVAWCSLL